MYQPQDFGPKEHLQVLLAEYSSLRSDQINRAGSGYQLVGFAITGIGVLIALKTSQPSLSILLPLLVLTVGLGLTAAVAVRDVQAMNVRVAELENLINGMLGERFMYWETRGGGTFGRYWRRITPMIRSLFREN